MRWTRARVQFGRRCELLGQYIPEYGDYRPVARRVGTVRSEEPCMNRDEWFRHTDWSPAIESAFFAKLARARDKAQYLRIQGGMLARVHPRVSLELLRRYFELGEDFDIAQAYCHRADAQLALRDIEGALQSYEAALQREEAFPRLLTEAYIELPLLIVHEKLSNRYEQALELLHKHRGRLMFPVDVFRWNGILAVLLSETGQPARAAEAANEALKAAGLTHSGFSRHAKVGLVGPGNADLLKRVQAIAKS